MHQRYWNWAAGIGCLGLILAPAHAGLIDYLGQQVVATGTPELGTTVGGLSGIDYDPASGTYWAISDDRSSVNPARFYNLSLDLSQFNKTAYVPGSSSPGSGGVLFNSVQTMKDPSGANFALNQVDPESIRVNRSSGTLYWTSEGSNTATLVLNPFVREMNTDGTYVRQLSTPAKFNPLPGPPPTGIRNNLAFESLTFSPSGQYVYTANEEALQQDGPDSGAAGQKTTVRVVQMTVSNGQPVSEFAYQNEPIVGPGETQSFEGNGLVELFAVGDRKFISLERSFSLITGYHIRLFLADATGATDVSSLSSLDGASFTPISKTLLLDLDTLRNADGTTVTLDNIEGLTLGPIVNGRQTLLLVSDNNFSAGQFTQFLAFSLAPVPEPSTYAMLFAGLGVIGFALRRRSARTTAI
jgi:hypothetical protein